MLIFFLSKSDYFSSRWRKIVRILKWIFGFICFVKYLRSYLQTREGGSDKYQICHVRQLDHAEKKVQNSFNCQTSPSRSKYLLNIFYHLFRLLGKVLISHIQLILKIFITSCLFSDWIASGSFINLLAYGPAINLHPNM